MTVHVDAEALLATIDFRLIVSVDMPATVEEAIVAEIEGLAERSVGFMTC